MSTFLFFNTFRFLSSKIWDWEWRLGEHRRLTFNIYVGALVTCFHFIVMTRVGHVNDWRIFFSWRLNNDVFLNGLIQIYSMLWITYFGKRFNVLGWSLINLSHILLFGLLAYEILTNLYCVCTTPKIKVTTHLKMLA